MLFFDFDISQRNQHRLKLRQAHEELEKRVSERKAELQRAREAPHAA